MIIVYCIILLPFLFIANDELTIIVIMIIWYVHKIVIEITNWIIIDDNFISFSGLIQWGFFRMTDDDIIK